MDTPSIRPSVQVNIPSPPPSSLPPSSLSLSGQSTDHHEIRNLPRLIYAGERRGGRGKKEAEAEAEEAGCHKRAEKDVRTKGKDLLGRGEERRRGGMAWTDPSHQSSEMPHSIFNLGLDRQNPLFFDA